MEAVNILKWVLLKQSPSPPHPSDTLKAQVNGHQCRVPACRACGSVKTERPRKKKKKERARDGFIGSRCEPARTCCEESPPCA